MTDKNLRLLFISPHPIEGQSSRYRIYQYLDRLNQLSISCKIRPFMNSMFYKIVYQSGALHLKIIFFILSTLNRFLDIIRCIRYDIIIILREAFPFGPPFFEILVYKYLRKPLVYDFDDAIFLGERCHVNRAVSFLKNPGKVARIIGFSHQVIGGNNYLKKYAEQFNQNVTVIPTPVDTEKYNPSNSSNKDGIIVGWMGSHSTADYLLELKNVFRTLKKKNSNLVIRLIGAEKYQEQLPGTECKAWRLKEEINDLSSFDIGLMPMPDDPWTRGKCAFKLLLYMSMGIPSICSPVGMNKEVIQEGENGFFALSTEEWLEKIQLLIKNPDLRKKIGLNGRKTVLEKYSLDSWVPVFIEVLEKAIKRK